MQVIPLGIMSEKDGCYPYTLNAIQLFGALKLNCDSKYKLHFFILQSWVLPNEAFQPRHEILDRETPLETLQDCGDSPGVVTENEVTNSNAVSTLESISGLSINPQHLQLPDWDFTYIVTDMLKYFAQEVMLLNNLMI